AALQVLTAIRRNQATLRDLVHDLRLYPQTLINVPLQPGLNWQEHARLQESYRDVQEELAGRGRALIRASGTEPKLRLMVEADDEALAKRCAQRLADSLT